MKVIRYLSILCTSIIWATFPFKPVFADFPYYLGSNGEKLPDFDQISFEDFPPMLTEGEVSLSEMAAEGTYSAWEIINLLGFDPSTEWQVGDHIKDVIKIGFFEEVFALQNLSLKQIGDQNLLADLDWEGIKDLPLEDFKLLTKQSIQDLVDAVPAIANASLRDLPFIEDALDNLGILDSLDDYDLDFANLENVIQYAIPDNILNNSLENLPINLNNYKIEDVPGLKHIPIKDLDNWEEAVMSDIPGMSSVPLGKLPNPVSLVGTALADVDVILGEQEGKISATQSGSNKEGYHVACDGNTCPHVELNNSLNWQADGTTWISGKYQQVKGGKGILGRINGGKEPTGRHPFGGSFKVALWDVDEVSDTVSTSLFFRICIKKLFIDLGCTPYFIGGFPWFTHGRDETIFLGL